MFCDEYTKLCEDRDNNLKTHLTEKGSLFRTFLPWRPYIFETVFQLQWYYDEFIIYDPIIFEITHFKTSDIEENKNKLRQLLIFLRSLKDSINSGFILFGSYQTFATENKVNNENEFQALLSIPAVRQECDKLVKVFRMESDEGKKNSYFNICCRYRNKQVLFTVVEDLKKIKTEGGYGVFFDLAGSNYTPITIEDARKEGFYDRAYDSFKDDFPFEIKEVLNYIDIGNNIKSPVLFNRDLDELVLKNISTENKLNKSRANDYYKLFLPFVNGIPPTRLYDLRVKTPNAFLEFRNLMFDIIYDCEKSGVETDMLELKVKQRINPLLRKLDAEMKNALTKAKIIGSRSSINFGRRWFRSMVFWN